ALATIALSLLPGALVTLYYMLALGIGPLELPWYAFTLAVGGQVGGPALVAWCVLLGCRVSVVAIVRSQRPLGADDEPDERPAPAGPHRVAAAGAGPAPDRAPAHRLPGPGRAAPGGHRRRAGTHLDPADGDRLRGRPGGRPRRPAAGTGPLPGNIAARAAGHG